MIGGETPMVDVGAVQFILFVAMVVGIVITMNIVKRIKR